MTKESVTYTRTKFNTKSQQGFHATVCPPILNRGTRTQTPDRGRKKKPELGRDLDPGIQFTVILPYPTVSGNHAVKHAKGQHYRTRGANAYRSKILLLLLQRGLAGPGWQPLTNLRVRIQMCPPDQKVRDFDNVLKELSDALTKAGFWVDDSNRVIRSWQIDWLPALPQGAIRITVEQWTP